MVLLSSYQVPRLSLFLCLLAVNLVFSSTLWGQSGTEIKFTVNSFDIRGEAPVEIEDTNSLLKPFLGVHRSIEGLQDAADTLEKAFHDLGYTFYAL